MSLRDFALCFDGVTVSFEGWRSARLQHELCDAHDGG